MLNPWEPKYYDELADSASQIAVKLAEDNQPDNAKEFANLSRELSDKALSISPRSVNFWSARAIYFKKLAIVDPHYLDLAIQALEKTVSLAPTDATFRLNLAVLYSYSGDLDRAIKTLEETLSLKPDYNQARDDLAQLYIEKGEK
ncbi:MAG: tetratricopeptide repeat protein [Candidatus Blackburnbacteria bacterium]|nr:tetratricopeptide repeat protein [Candidatus Blackburnbacteria bacterium]